MLLLYLFNLLYFRLKFRNKFFLSQILFVDMNDTVRFCNSMIAANKRTHLLIYCCYFLLSCKGIIPTYKRNAIYNNTVLKVAR